MQLLSGVPDLFDRNKILSGGDLSYYQVPHCIRVFFYSKLCTFVFTYCYARNNSTYAYGSSQRLGLYSLSGRTSYRNIS